MKKLYTTAFALLTCLGCCAATIVEIIPINSETPIVRDSLVRSIVLKLDGEILVNDRDGGSYQLTSEEFGRIQFYIGQETNVDAIENDSKVSITLNPVMDVATIINLSGNDDIKVVSANGVVLFRFHSNETEQKIDVSHLPSGVYFLLINKKECVKFQKN